MKPALFCMACVLVVGFSSAQTPITPPTSYRTNAEMITFMDNMNAQYPAITRRYSIGSSVNGNDMAVFVIGAVATEPPSELAPKIKYVGNIHGNEAVSREILANFIEYLLVNYNHATYTTITTLLDTTQIHIMPTMNPDGFAAASPPDCLGVTGRENANGQDLNRNFPDYHQPNSNPREIETQNVMDWLDEHNFVLSANLHGGAMVVNYPYDNYPAAGPARDSPSPDDLLFEEISRNYSFSHASMSEGNFCGDNFLDGITNGAEWYPIAGGMQDYNYFWAGCMEVTIEVSCCKYPTVVDSYWTDNRDALLNYLLQVNRGIKGLVTDEATTNPINGATVTVQGREVFMVNTTARGEYWRMLLPGSHTIQVSANGYASKSSTIEVPLSQSSQMIVNFQLTPAVAEVDDDFSAASVAVPQNAIILALTTLILAWSY